MMEAEEHPTAATTEAPPMQKLWPKMPAVEAPVVARRWRKSLVKVLLGRGLSLNSSKGSLGDPSLVERSDQRAQGAQTSVPVQAS
jgi:hypothetical protein